MGYRLRLHGEVRQWLTELCGTEPQLAWRVGEAVVALLDTGECLGPPAVVPPESVFRPHCVARVSAARIPRTA